MHKCMCTKKGNYLPFSIGGWHDYKLVIVSVVYQPHWIGEGKKNATQAQRCER